MKMIKGIAHVCISSTDLEASERFYLNGLGLTKCFDFIRNDEIVGYYLKVSDRMFIEAFHRDEVEGGEKAPVRHFCLETDSIDTIRDHLISRGYEVGEKKLGADHAYQAWVTDPSGVRIEFHEYTEKSTQLTGENCILN